MKSTSCRRVAYGLVVLAWLLPPLAWAQAPEEFQKRRQAIRDAMDPGSVLVLTAPAANEEEFRQNRNLFYLTGLDEPGISLVLYAGKPGSAPSPGATVVVRDGVVMRGPGGPAGDVLFVPAPAGPPVPGGGPAPAAATPLGRPGFSTVRPASDFERTLDMLLLSSPPAIYLDIQRSRSLSSPLTADEQKLKAARDRGATFTVKPAAALVASLRVIKSAAEIDLIQHATDITAEAHKQVMRAARPGLFEYQLQAVIEFTFALNGARHVGFSSIVGSGPNGTVLHWSENTRKTEPGDLVVMDIGAEHGMYSSDITRTIPISGTFTPRQRQVYEVVLRANEEAIAMVAPGVNWRDVSAKATSVLAEGLIKLGVIKDAAEVREYYYHGLTHHLGLQVHDPGPLGVLQPGMVFTIEPGLYFRKEGFGIRIEDDVLVTETGHKVLSAGAPKSVQDVEAAMKQDGLDLDKVLIGAAPAKGEARKDAPGRPR